MITEEYLQFLWQTRFFLQGLLKSTDGRDILIKSVGSKNTDSGPDFFNVKIKTEEALWVGNVEIHIKSSYWEQHGHHKDPAYNNVVLHVVYEADKEVYTTRGEKLICLEVKNLISQEMLEKSYLLLNNRDWIPCSNSIHKVDSFTINNWLHRMCVDRLEQKAEIAHQILSFNNHDWEETAYQILAGGFGIKINKEPFMRLARSLPFSILKKHKGNLLQIEALLFGQSGMIEELQSDDEYVKQLQKEYNFLQKKYKLKPLDKSIWKFMRLRPISFPTIRIALFAQIINKTDNLFSTILQISQSDELMLDFLNVQTSPYWSQHFTFNKKSIWKTKKTGNSTIDIVMINIIAPLLFLYGQEKASAKHKDRALKLLEITKPEQNNIIKKWLAHKVTINNAQQSQGAIHLKTQYCDLKKCLSCAIGFKILTN